MNVVTCESYRVRREIVAVLAKTEQATLLVEYSTTTELQCSRSRAGREQTLAIVVPIRSAWTRELSWRYEGYKAKHAIG